MIGGLDIIIYGAAGAGEGRFIVSCLGAAAAWPGLRVQESSADVAVPPDDDGVATMREFFVYRSRADFESWMRVGASHDNSDSMVHIIMGDDSTTIVTEPPPSQTHQFGSALRDAVVTRRILLNLDAEGHPAAAAPGGYRERFQELLSDLLLAREDMQAVPPHEARRMEALSACWHEMTEAERANIRDRTSEPFAHSVGPQQVALEDRDVKRGQRLPPTRRAAA